VWDCRDFWVFTKEGEMSTIGSTAECPEDTRVAGCMCNSWPNKGCRGSFVV